MTTPFTVIPATTIDDSNLVSSTITEDDYPEWSDASVAYVTGDRRIVIADHLIYEAAQDHTSSGANAPDPNGSTEFWLVVGPTNKYAAFDQAEGTVSNSSSDITFVVTGSDITGMHFRNVTGESIRIQASNGMTTYYDETYELIDQGVVLNWWDYFYGTIRTQSQYTTLEVPPAINSTYTITIAARESVAEIGTFVMGTYIQYGFTQYNAKLSSVRYGKTTTDQFGTTKLRAGGGAFRMNVSIVAERGVVDAIAYDLLDLSDTAAVWLAAYDTYRSLSIYGFYNDWDIDIANPSYSYATLQIQGFT